MDYRTKDGELLRMERVLYSNDVGSDYGWVTHCVMAFIGDCRVGVISMSWIPEIDKLYPDLDTYAKKREKGGWATERDLRRFKSFHGSPYVASVFVPPPNQRRHIALRLYQEAALWVAEKWNMPLRQGDPNDASTALWAKLIELGEPIMDVDIDEYEPRKALDYRDLVKSSGSDVSPTGERP